MDRSCCLLNLALLNLVLLVGRLGITPKFNLEHPTSAEHHRRRKEPFVKRFGRFFGHFRSKKQEKGPSKPRNRVQVRVSSISTGCLEPGTNFLYLRLY